MCKHNAKDVHMPGPMYEGDGGREAVVVVNYELEVSARLVAFVGQCCMLGTLRPIRLIHLIDNMRHFTQVYIQP